MRNPKLLPLAAAVLLAGCAVGPDYLRPADPPVNEFTRAAAPVHTGAAAELAFWRRIEDPLLTALVEDALRANHDLRIGLARLDQARASLRPSRLDAVPTITADAAGSDVRGSASELPGVGRAQRDGEVYEANVRAFWELDLFGRVRRGIEAGRAGREAAEADLAALQVAVVAELARTYVGLRGLQAQLAVAQGNAAVQAETLDLVEVREEAGRGTAFDTARARALLESTRARVPALETAVAASLHRLAVLTGRTPEQLPHGIATPAPIPALPAQIAIADPADLLRRRPDIAAAERRLAAATARIGIATADLFPRLSFSGLIGSRALDADDLFARDSEQRVLALGIDWSFLDVGRVRARIASAEAGADEALARYRQTVLRALEETENALVRSLRSRREVAHLEAAAAASAEAARLARLRFDGGVADFLAVLDAERVRLDADDRLAQARTAAADAQIALYAALAGGWPEIVPESPAAGR